MYYKWNIYNLNEKDKIQMDNRRFYVEIGWWMGGQFHGKTLWFEGTSWPTTCYVFNKETKALNAKY